MKQESLQGKRVAISGSGNVAIFACQKAQELGAKVITMSDSNGCILRPGGHPAGCGEGHQAPPPWPHPGVCPVGPRQRVPQRLPGSVVRPLRRGPALCHPE